MTNNYADVTTFKEKLGKTLSGSDDQIQRALDSAARAVDEHTGRIRDGFVADAVANTRLFVGSGEPVQRIDECIAITLVEVRAGLTDADYVAWASTDWIPFWGPPENPVFDPITDGRPYTKLMTDLTGTHSVFTTGTLWRALKGKRVPQTRDTVRVTARWGFAESVPPPIQSATIALAAKIVKAEEMAYAESSANPDFGEIIIRGLTDSRIKSLLSGFLRPHVG